VWLRFALVAWFCVASLLCGCSRRFYRLQADRDAYAAMKQAAIAGNTGAPPLTMDIAPESRMFDPNDPDCPPMPPDDPASHRYLHCVDCKKGSICWRCAAKTPYTENPRWLDYLPRNDAGQIELDMEAAVLVALMHSPDYQENLEELYLSALDVTFERFRFDTQFFGGSSVFFTSDGPDRPGGPRSELLVAPLGPALQARRLTATGAELVVGFANSLVWQFAGPDDYRGNTLIDFNLVQPLLRQGGRQVVLERLTITERALLANVRQMERFRRGFYTEITTGRNAGQGPSRRGGFFGGAGLEGFTGVGGGGFGRVGGGFGGGGGGEGIAGGAGAARAGGFLGLLQNSQEISNSRANVAALRDSVAQLSATYDAGRIDRFQVDLARQALYNAQSQLLIAEAGYASQLDDFKIDLGLPPHLEVKISDTLLDRFNLIEPELTVLQSQVSEALGAARESVRDPLLPGVEVVPLPPVEEVPGVSPLVVLEGITQQFPTIQENAQQHVAQAIEDYAELEQVLPQRRANIAELRNRVEVQTGRVERSPFDPARLDERVETLRRDLDRLQNRLANTFAQMEALAANPPESAVEFRRTAVDVLTKLSGELLELSLVQARARLDTVGIEPIDLSSEEALVIASLHRRDWQNARANLVDSWRLVGFNANDLMSDLDLTFSGDISNLRDNPFDLRSSTGRLQVGLEFDAPLTRVSERNVYRQAVIEYQQARRNYYQFVDRIYQQLRDTLRTVRLNELNFELRREAVHIAISQVDLTQLRLAEPPPPAAQPGQVGAAQFGNTTARDLVQALSDLLSVQNDFLSVWVNFEVQRMGLDLDLGTMQLDDRGLWVDHGLPFKSFLPADFCGPGNTSGPPPGLNGMEPADQPAPVDGPELEALPVPSGYPREAVFGPPAVNLKES
jgi:outer membrane protein TolC